MAISLLIYKPQATSHKLWICCTRPRCSYVANLEPKALIVMAPWLLVRKLTRNLINIDYALHRTLHSANNKLRPTHQMNPTGDEYDSCTCPARLGEGHGSSRMRGIARAGQAGLINPLTAFNVPLNVIRRAHTFLAITHRKIVVEMSR